MPADQVVVAVGILQRQLDTPLVHKVRHERVSRYTRRHVHQDRGRWRRPVDNGVRLAGAGAYLVDERRSPCHVVVAEQLRLRQEEEHVGQADQP